MALHRRVVLASFILAAGCTADTDRLTDITLFDGPAANVTAGCTEEGSHSSEFYNRIWSCDDVINVQIIPSGTPYGGDVVSARNVWNDAIPGGYGLPRFVGSGVPATPGKVVKVMLNLTGGSAQSPMWCGQTIQSADSVILYRVSSVAGCPSSNYLVVTDLQALATHELGHALGFSQVHLSDRAPESTTGICVMYVDDHFNSPPCPLEPQIMLWSYGQRSTEPDETVVLQSVSVPALIPISPTIQTGQSVLFTATTSPASALVSWTTSNPGVASISPSGGNTATGTGVTPGTTKITASVEAPDVLWPARRFQILTVITPPPLDVWIEGPAEVLPAATCTWFATVYGGTGPYTIQWSGFGSGSDWSTTVQVPSGGGSLELDVWDATGAHQSASYPVTTSPSAPWCNQ